MRKLLETMAISYLKSRGLLVLEFHYPMLLVSGNALAISTDDERTQWTVSFPVKPYIVALEGSVVTKRQIEFRAGETP